MVAWSRNDHLDFKIRYPPDKQEEATETVIKQAESLSAEWVAA